MSQSKRLVFFGNERLVSGLKKTEAPLLQSLITAGYDIVAVVANHEEARSRSARRLEVADIAAKHSIPVLLPNKPADILDTLRELQADAAVLSAYGRIIPASVLDIFEPVGIINLHPSLLPRHRGSTPIESTILQGDNTAGISIMKLAPGMDDGPLYAQAPLSLRGDETKFELYDILARMGAKLLVDLLPDILSGALKPEEQQKNDASYTTTVSKKDGLVDLSTDTAEVVERKVRAYLGFPKTRLILENNDVFVTSSSVVESLDSAPLVVECANKTYLAITQLVAPSGKTMSGEAYMRGHGNKT